MAGGIVEAQQNLILCKCGSQPDIIWHYIKGVPNRINYFVRCKNCKARSRDRRKIEGAVHDWNNKYKINYRGESYQQ